MLTSDFYEESLDTKIAIFLVSLRLRSSSREILLNKKEIKVWVDFFHEIALLHARLIWITN